MSNWLENNQTKSVIIFTVFIVGSTWAAFRYVYWENKINFYQDKITTLEKEINLLRDENKKYLEWVTNTPNSIPYLEQKIKLLTEEIHPKMIELRAGGTLGGVTGGASIAVVNLPYANRSFLDIGETWIDERTDMSFGIGRIMPDFTVSAVLALPGKKPQEFEKIKPGKSWTFVKDAKNYQFIVSKIDWYSNKVEVRLNEIKSVSEK